MSNLGPPHPPGDPYYGRQLARPEYLPPAYGAYANPYNASAEESERDGILAYWHILSTHKILICASCLAGLALGYLFSLLQTPLYEAKASLEFQNLNENFLNSREVDPVAVNYSADSYMQTQIKILQSDSLSDRTVAKLRGEASPVRPEETGAGPTLRKVLHVSDGARGPSPLDLAAKSLRVRGSGMTRIVELSCETSDPKLAADFTNTLANEFIQQSVESRWELSQRTSEWLNRQLQDLRNKLEQSETKVYAKAQSSGLMISDKENLAEEKLKQLQSELFRAQTDRVMKQSKYELSSSSPLDSLPEVIDDPSLRDYQRKLVEMRRELADLSATLTSAHPKVQRLQLQVAELKNSFERERGNILRRIQTEFESAKRREALMENAYLKQAKLVSEQAGQTVQYNLAKRELDTNRQVYDAILQKAKEAGLASSLGNSTARIVDHAKIPLRPSKPNPVLSSAVGLFLGGLISMAFAVQRSTSNLTFKCPGDVTDYLNTPELGVIPSASVDPAAPSRWNRNSTSDSGAIFKETDGGAKKPELAGWKRRPSLMSESFHSAMTSILLSRRDTGSRKIFVVTSAGPEEGKTLTSINLSIAYAKTAGKVLLIDADLRKPRLHQVFNFPQSPGLSDILAEPDSLDRSPIESFVRETPVKNLYVLTSGEASPGMIPHLLHSIDMDGVLGKLRQHFDAIFIDTPPVLHIADARLIGRKADSVILVVRAGKTLRTIARAAVQQLARDGIPVVGTLLNDWNPESTPGHASYYATYQRYYIQKS